MHDELQSHNAQVFVIGAAATAKAVHIAEVFKSPFPILADPSRSAYSSYGFSKVLGLIQKSGTALVDLMRPIGVAPTGIIAFIAGSVATVWIIRCALVDEA